MHLRVAWKQPAYSRRLFLRSRLSSTRQDNVEALRLHIQRIVVDTTDWNLPRRHPAGFSFAAGAGRALSLALKFDTRLPG
jgi:hypothetical protein